MLKIEGRARGAEYVKRVVECYDEALRAIEAGTYTPELAAGLKERLATVFNRGFWEGYYAGRPVAEHSEHYGSAATRRKVYVGITKALAAVLQLGVTMDYSIFLWHSYQEQKERFDGDKNRAMAHAISNTITSVVSSSITTVAGFIALCFMSFTLGKDLGIVMAKGVVFGVIGCVTILPSLILVCDKAIEKTRHKVILPDLSRIAGFITKHHVVFVIAVAGGSKKIT